MRRICGYQGKEYRDIDSTGVMSLAIIVLISCSGYRTLNNCLPYGIFQLLAYILSLKLFFYSVVHKLCTFIYKMFILVTFVMNDLTQITAGRVLTLFKTQFSIKQRAKIEKRSRISLRSKQASWTVSRAFRTVKTGQLVLLLVVYLG